MPAQLRTKSLSDPSSPEDGYRLLISRYRCGRKNWDGWDPRLGPSASLLARTRQRQKTHPATCWDEYRQQFLTEMRRPDAIEALRRVRAILDSGVTVTLLCYCPDESRCHRSLVRKLLEATCATEQASA